MIKLTNMNRPIKLQLTWNELCFRNITIMVQLLYMYASMGGLCKKSDVFLAKHALHTKVVYKKLHDSTCSFNLK